jgi:hypothetical protein
MTKKCFIALADAVIEHNRYTRECHSEPFTERQINVLCVFCKSQNSQFNVDRFKGYIAGTNGKNGGSR